MKRSVLGALALAGILCSAEANAGDEALPLSRDEMSWHVRAALNVAALGCRDYAEQQTIASYNQLLARHRTPLAAADAGVKAEYRVRFGAAWESLHDRDMTRVYNFFAHPRAHDGFCAEARLVLAEAEAVEPGHFADFAAYALPRLHLPFTGAVVERGNVYLVTETASLGGFGEILPQR